MHITKIHDIKDIYTRHIGNTYCPITNQLVHAINSKKIFKVVQLPTELDLELDAGWWRNWLDDVMEWLMTSSRILLCSPQTVSTWGWGVYHIGGVGVGGAVLSIALNIIISKIGWGHLMGQPPRGGPTAYQN